jgi:hypothetical protein
VKDRAVRLAELERCLDTCPDLGQVMNMFFDVVAADPTLAADARPYVSDSLTSITQHVAREALRGAGLGRRGQVLTSWLRLAEHDFVHGQLVAGGRIGVAFFFERRGLGLVALVTGSSYMLYGRLRALGRPRADPARN